MSSFIRVAEVWSPSADQQVLEWSGGWYEHAPALGVVSPGMVFGRAEGLPGHAWDEGHPLVLQQWAGSYFRRTEQAQAAGLRCAVALPVFDEDRLTSVALLFCGDEAGSAAPGAIELWRNDPRVSTDLTLAEGYYGTGTGAAALEALSRDGALPRGSGAPGLAWQRGEAVFIDKVDRSHQFLRAQIAAEAGILRALALPCSTRLRETWVLSLLASRERPIARRVECWLPQDGPAHWLRASGFCEVHGKLGADPRGAQPADSLGPVGRAATRRAAQLGLGDAARSLWRQAPSPPGGTNGAVLALPLVEGGEVAEVVALYF
jgi:hypothetical protein